MVEIPQFSAEELRCIIQLFGHEGVPLSFTAVTTAVSGHRGVTEYLLQIEEEDLPRGLNLLIDCYSIAPEFTEPYEGPCPACETAIRSALECPDCGLSVSVGTPKAVLGHPFYCFLKDRDLLPRVPEES